MTADLLTEIVAIAMSLAFSYVPGLNTWYEGLSKEVKQMTMGIALIIAAGAVFGLSCGGVLVGLVECTQSGVLGLVKVLIEALIANQAAFLITKKFKKL